MAESVGTKRTTSARVLATLFLGVLFGIYKQTTQVRWSVRGRDAFLADQSQVFNAGMMPPHGAFVNVVAGLILAVVAAGIYELLVAGIASILPRSTVEE